MHAQVDMDFINSYPYRLPPFEHQKEYLRRSVHMPFFAALMEMGTGKSKATIDETAMQFDMGMVTGLLVAAPKGVYRNWVGELRTHMPEHIKTVIAVWKNVHNKKDEAFYRRVCTPEPNTLMVFLVNIEGFQHKKSRAIAQAKLFLRGHKAKMVIDESTKIASVASTRTKETIALGGMADFRRILTGSPGDDPRKVFPQSQFLQAGLLGFNSFVAYRNRYCIIKEEPLRPGPNGEQRSFPMCLGFHNLPELQDKLKKFSYRVTKAECLDLPEKMYTTREVDLTEEQEKLYREMRDKAVAWIATNMASAPIALTQTLRMHQIVCGVLKDDDGNEHDVPNNRLDALMDVLEETAGKVIIWANYRRNIEVIRDTIKNTYGEDSVVTYYGDTSGDARVTAVERFQGDSRCRFFVGNPATGGYGITLTAANTVVYYSNSYSLEQRLQSEDRAHRIGQRNAVLYVDLVTPGTVDVKVVEALAKKIDVQAQITGDELQAWLDVSSLTSVKGRPKADTPPASGSLAVDETQLSFFEADQLK